jgi:putative oxidoreductase
MSHGKVTEITYFLLRVVSGFLFFQAGAAILFGWFGGMPGPPESKPPLLSQIGIGGVLEFFGGIGIMLGLLTRPVALLFVIECALIALAVPLRPGTSWLWLGATGKYPAVVAVLCFAFVLRGGGRSSLDRLIGKEF